MSNTLVINLQQLNTLFGLAMPAIVAFLAGVIRQDRFPQWSNSIITAAVLLILAAVQTYLSNSGGDIIHFLALAAWSAVGIQSKYGAQFQAKIQTTTSIGKTPPAAPQQPAININPAQIAALIWQELQPILQGQAPQTQQPVPDQPTQTLQAVRTNTPPQGG